MRIGTLILVLVLVPAALAQPCDPAQTDEACADTTTWQRYFPLDVGNQWQYRDAFYDEPVAHWSWTVIGQTEVEGQSYFELERCDEAADGSATCAAPILVRYDDEHELIVRRTDSDEGWWDELPCSMAADFNSEQSCTGPALEDATVMVWPGRYGASVTVPPDVVSGDTDKYFDWQFFRGWRMFAGLGVTEFHYELQGEPTRLVYANVGGEQVGTSAFASCDPSELGEGEVCPDTTDWRRYFPLAVGNRWQYHVVRTEEPSYDHGTEIVGETEIEGETYFLARRCEGVASGDVMCGEPVPVRYDDDLLVVVRRSEDDGSPTLSPYHASDYASIPQPLDAVFCYTSDFTSEACDSGIVGGEYGAGFEGLGDTEKTFDSGFAGTITLVAGVGATGAVSGKTDFFERLFYARVDGEEVGTPLFTFPTSSEPETGQPIATAFTQTYPNPACGAMRAQYALGAPQAVTLELIDLLGRRVRSVEVGPQPAGTHDVRLDLGGLRAGLYVLRLRGDAGDEATQRIVVVR